MSSCISPPNYPKKINPFHPFRKSNIFYSNPSMISTSLWRNIAKRAISRRIQNFPLDQKSFSRSSYAFLGLPLEPISAQNFNYKPSDFTGTDLNQSYGFLGNEIGINGVFPKGFASVAEAVSSTDVEEDVVGGGGDEVQELLQELKREEKRQVGQTRKTNQSLMRGMGFAKYQMLKRRQVRIETEAWEQAAKEYKELLKDVCEQKLAPNLPYMKSLFLGWFEPLTDAITKEQELFRLGKHKAAYAPFIDRLPADMMAVITMHKLMGLLMMGYEHGTARVVQASCVIGEAIEDEAKIHKLLEKTRRKKVDKDNKKEGDDLGAKIKEGEKLRKKVSNLIKKQKLQAVRMIIKGHDNSKPWTQDARPKVGSRLIELLIQTAYIQPPANQLAEGPPDIRPAFVHSSRAMMVDTSKPARRFGIIQCDPLVIKGLEKTARHMVIPYVPMLVPPVNWSGYDKGGHLFLPSYIMRTHGAKQQREAVKRVPKKQLEPVFEALDTLGNTKWRVNKKVLSVVDRVRASGACLADLVDRDDLLLPDKPETEDETLIKKWKWKVKSLKKENREKTFTAL